MIGKCYLHLVARGMPQLALRIASGRIYKIEQDKAREEERKEFIAEFKARFTDEEKAKWDAAWELREVFSDPLKDPQCGLDSMPDDETRLLLEDAMYGSFLGEHDDALSSILEQTMAADAQFSERWKGFLQRARRTYKIDEKDLALAKILRAMSADRREHGKAEPLSSARYTSDDPLVKVVQEDFDMATRVVLWPKSLEDYYTR